MALTTCRECAESVSTEAAACPHCGAPGPTRRGLVRSEGYQPQPHISKEEREQRAYRLRMALVGVILVAAFGSMFALRNSGPPAAPAAASAPASAPTLHVPFRGELLTGTHITRGGDLGCLVRGLVKRAVELNADKVAFERYVSASLKDGTCVLLKPDLTVYVEVVDENDLIRIRPKGEPTTIWTIRPAIAR